MRSVEENIFEQKISSFTSENISFTSDSRSSRAAAENKEATKENYLEEPEIVQNPVGLKCCNCGVNKETKTPCQGGAGNISKLFVMGSEIMGKGFGMTIYDIIYDLLSFKETFGNKLVSLLFKSLLITDKSGVGVNSKPKKQRSRHGCHSQTQSFIALNQGNHTIYKEADKKSFEKSTKNMEKEEETGIFHG